MLLEIQRGVTLRLLRTSGTSWGDLPSVFLMAEAEPQKQTKSESRNVGCAGGDSGRRHSRDSASLSMSERALGSEGCTRCASMSPQWVAVGISKNGAASKPVAPGGGSPAGPPRSAQHLSMSASSLHVTGLACHSPGGVAVGRWAGQARSCPPWGLGNGGVHGAPAVGRRLRGSRSS